MGEVVFGKLRDIIFGAIYFYSERGRLCDLYSIRKAIKEFLRIDAINSRDYQYLMKCVNREIKDYKAKYESMINKGLEMLEEENIKEVKRN